MSGPPPAPGTGAAAELERLRLRCAELEDANTRSRRINEKLMDRVERDMDMQGNSFSLFQAAISLEARSRSAPAR